MRLCNRLSTFGIYGFIAAGLISLPPTSAHAQAVTATIPVGGSPQAVAVNPVTNTIYVPVRPGDCGNNAVTGWVAVIDGGTNSTTMVPAGYCPTAVAVNTVTNKIYVTNWGHSEGSIFRGQHVGSSITVIDGATNTAETISDPLITTPGFVAIDPATNKIYVIDGGDVTVIDGATNSLTNIVPDSSYVPVAIAVNPLTNRIYVAGSGDFGSVTVIDGATSAITNIVDPSAISPVSVAVNSNTGKIYVANVGDGGTTNYGSISVIDGATNSVTIVTDPNALWPGADSHGFGVATNPTTNRIYVTNEVSHNVTVIDGAANSTTTVTDPEAVAPVAVAVNETTNTIYVANGGCALENANSCNPGTVTAIDGATNSTTTIFDPNANTPRAIAVNPTTNKMYVANSGSNNVTVIDGNATATTHSLSVSLAGNGSGTVASNPAGINCGTSCSASFAAATVVNLTAAPASGSGFSGWSGVCTGTDVCSINMNGDDFVTATFNAENFSLQPASASLTVQSGGQVTDVITIAPSTGGSFGSAIQLSCAASGPAPTPTCALSPTSVTPGTSSAAATLTINAPAMAAMSSPIGYLQRPGSLYALWLPLMFGITLVAGSNKHRQRFRVRCGLLMLLLVLPTASCGGSDGNTTLQPRNYTVTITGTSGVLQHAAHVTLTVQ